MPHTEQKRCRAVAVLNVYSVRTSLPETSLNCDFGTMRCRYPVFAHIEQLQSVTEKRAGATTSKRTRPQWHPPLCVIMAPSRADPMLRRDRCRRAGRPGEKLPLRNSSLELRDELVRIEVHPDRVGSECIADHVRVGLLRGGEAIDLEL